MSGRKRQSERDRRRRSLGQNFLVDQALVDRLIAELALEPGELVLDLGAGSGALTIPLARAGVRVWAVEKDREWAGRLQTSVSVRQLDDRVRVIRSDLLDLRLPKEPFRVVANPPFNLTTATMAKLLDRPSSLFRRADLILQLEVARKHSAQPPAALRTAAWAPWWEFSMGRRVPASAFRPKPSVDAAVLTAVRRSPPILPDWLGPQFAELLRPAWQPPQGSPRPHE